MIKMIRVDYRLLHGQVAVSWTSSIGVDAILLVSDTLQKDKLRMQTIRIAKPDNVKVVVKNTDEAIEQLNSGVTDKYSLFIVCETINNAAKIIENTGFNNLNLGNVAFKKNAIKFSNSVYLDNGEVNILNSLVSKGEKIFAQTVPNDNKHYFK